MGSSCATRPNRLGSSCISANMSAASDLTCLSAISEVRVAVGQHDVPWLGTPRRNHAISVQRPVLASFAGKVTWYGYFTMPSVSRYCSPTGKILEEFRHRPWGKGEVA